MLNQHDFDQIASLVKTIIHAELEPIKSNIIQLKTDNDGTKPNQLAYDQRWPLSDPNYQTSAPKSLL